VPFFTARLHCELPCTGGGSTQAR